MLRTALGGKPPHQDRFQWSEAQCGTFSCFEPAGKLFDGPHASLGFLSPRHVGFLDVSTSAAHVHQENQQDTAVTIPVVDGALGETSCLAEGVAYTTGPVLLDARTFLRAAEGIFGDEDR